MHIKKIIIQGFKTYRNTTVIDLLSPHYNVVVGRNGSGKSNFFAAIRFVLSDAYTHMTREERQGLIHEGSGTVMSAYVEIVFDNSDGRFPINKTEISIRRTIGLKKDDYSLDGKSATRSDIMNLLESAGFSRSNPYYIVPQGRITALTNSKDSERLTLLKEVSGATVFESKLKESMKEMNNSNYKKQRIDETLTSIDERLSDLQIESADLKKYQSLERSKKILEFNLFDRELNNLTESIEAIDENYGELLAESQKDLEELDKREKLCQQLTETINELKVSLKISKLEKEQSDIDYKRLLTVISEKELKLNELKSQVESSREQFEELQSSIDHYKSLIKQHEDEISKYKPGLKELQNQEAIVKNKLIELTSKQRAIYSKQNRFSKFSSREERDSWLNKEITSIKEQVESKESEISTLNSEISSKNETLSQMSQRINELTDLINNNGKAELINNLKISINELKLKSVELTDKRKVLWREEIRIKSICDSIQNDLNNASHAVNQTMDKAQAQGLNAVKSITAKLHLQDNVFGPLAELFSVNDKYKTAVEVIAGNSLFHVVVDNDKTASLIMDELIRTKAGRVTFMPLNRLNPEDVEYPDSEQYQSIPLIKKLKYDDEKVGKAIKQVFRKTIVCSDLQTGSELARSFKLTAITLDGDRANNKGVLSGGFREYKKSRIDALKVQIKKKKELIRAQNDLNNCIKEIEAVNQELTSTTNELKLKIRDLDKQISSQEPYKIELSQLNNKKYNLEQETQSLNATLNSSLSIKKKLDNTLAQHETERSSEFTQALTNEEVQALQGLNDQINKNENDLDSIVTRLSEIDTNISKFESELNNNYKPHLSKLLKEQKSPKIKLNELEVEELEKELEALHIQLDTSESRNQSATDEFNKINNEINQSEETLKKANHQQVLVMKKLEKFSKTTEKSLNKKAILVSRRDEIQKKIRELGVLPEEAFQQSNYVSYSSDQLLRKLNSINNELLKYSHINKKALEQYNTFTKQRSELAQRKEELEKSKESIENLIKKLEAQKDEAITKSFKQVAKSFREIFEKLVPAGIGHLIMQKRSSATDAESRGNDANSEEIRGSEISATDDQEQHRVENYVGVAISVSFSSKHDEQQRIEQLSGGQKSLCAIALILAIQKCDPAPFYLLDEIDANLDTQYRTAVASMIKALSTKAQFICTTFRPEMLQVADKFYGVMFSNKVSTISEINREEAMTFVEGQQQR